LTALTGREEADAAILAARKVLAEKTEMTVNVNWSGGGKLKDGIPDALPPHCHPHSNDGQRARCGTSIASSELQQDSRI